MGPIKSAICAFLVLTLTSCTGVKVDTFGVVSADRITPAVTIVRHDVIVSQDLTTSEANLYYPLVDIVWRDDPPGDRHAQVGKLLTEAMDWGLSAFNRGPRAVVTLEVKKFHALSQKARYSVGGVHTMRFRLIVRSAATGQAIYGPVEVNADLRALGGNAAIEADAEGRTQKARIRQHVAGTVQRVLLNAGLGTAAPIGGNG